MLGHRAIAEGPLAALLDEQVIAATTTTEYFASRSFATRATDPPAHRFIPGRIVRGLRLSRRITTAESGQFGSLIETDFGEIQLANNDGALDNLVQQYAADGRQIRLKIGSTETDSNGLERVQPYANFATVYTSVAGPWSFEHDVVRLRIEDLSNRLQSQLQQAVYGGTGGSEGTADIAGRTKPTALGRCLNVTAQLVDPAILTYQLHAGSIQEVEAVYDAGIDVPVGTDYPTYAALAAASTGVGLHDTCLAGGFIKLGIIPIGTVTADLKGDLQTSPNVYVGNHGSIMRMILLDYAGFIALEIDSPSFDTLNNQQFEGMGLFLPSGDTSTVHEVLERIAFAVGAFVGQDRSGLLRTQRLDPPSATVVHWAFNDRDIIAIEREALPYGVPWRAWGVGYQNNWTVQTDAELAGAVTQDRRLFLKSERRFVYAQSPSIAIAHASSSGMDRHSLMIGEAAAEQEAQRLIGLYSFGRAIYRVVVKNALFSVELGQTIRLTYDRWDLHGGKNFVAIGIEDDADRIETTLRVFG